MAEPSDTPSLTLYSSPISDCAARVRIALNLKHLPYKIININLRKTQNHDAEYSNISASRTIPSLVIDDRIVLNQSLAAVEYLDEMFTDPRLLPSNPVTRAKVRSLANIIAMDTHPLTTHRVGRAHRQLFSGAAVDKHADWGLYWITQGLETFERAIADTAGEYCVGSIVTLADICQVPELWTAERLGVDLSRYPTIARLYENLSQVDEIRNARQDPTSELE